MAQERVEEVEAAIDYAARLYGQPKMRALMLLGSVTCEGLPNGSGLVEVKGHLLGLLERISAGEEPLRSQYQAMCEAIRQMRAWDAIDCANVLSIGVAAANDKLTRQILGVCRKLLEQHAEYIRGETMEMSDAELVEALRATRTE